MTKKIDQSPDTPTLTDWEKRRMAMYRDAAQEAAKEVLLSFGFNTADAGTIQKNQVFLTKLRVTSEAANLKIVTSAIALIFGVIGAVVMLAFQTFLGK